MHDRHRDIELFRHSLIREAADPTLTAAERGQAKGAVRMCPDEWLVALGFQWDLLGPRPE